MKEAKLSERKQKILKVVVDEYIKKAQPVASGDIQKNYFPDISSATIRSELSTLEDMGYLIQPHTSAGRIPSALAYKYFCDNFVDKRPLRKQDVAKIDASFSSRFAEVQEIVKTAAKVISDVTNYTSVIVLKNINDVKIKDIKLVGLDEHSALVIIITDSGIIRDKTVTISGRADETFVKEANQLINHVFVGKTVGDLKSMESEVDNELSEFRELFDSILQILLSYCETTEEDVFMEGASKMLENPDASRESVKNFLSIIDDKKSVADLLGDSDGIEFSVKIGKDETGGMDKCAIVTAKYSVNGKEVGHAGVIGPERMDYGKVMSVLSYVGSALDSLTSPNKLTAKRKPLKDEGDEI